MCPRTISPATAALISACNEAGETVSARQIERWRQLDLLPRPARHALGRGRGSTTTYPEQTVDTAVAVARSLRTGHRLDQVALVLFADGIPVPESAIRRAFIALLDQLDATIVADDGSVDPFARAEDFATTSQKALLRRPHWRHRRRRLRGVAESPDSAFGSLITNIGRSVLGDTPPPDALDEMAQAFGYSTKTNDADRPDAPPIDGAALGDRLDQLTLPTLHTAATEASLNDLITARDCLIALCGPTDEAPDITRSLMAAARDAGHPAPLQPATDPLIQAIEVLALASLRDPATGANKTLDDLQATARYVAALRGMGDILTPDEMHLVLSGGLDDPTTPASQSSRICDRLEEHYRQQPEQARILLESRGTA